ncbi:MAG: glycosyltransferase [Eubacterium sp.]|nr:glycosyltransferase [Eubacterium sp.]
MRKTDVSVIFATHNREDVLEQVFDAWRKTDRATKYKYEIICSDDASTDRTVAIIESVRDLPVKLVRNQKGGAGKARNAALAVAAGKLVIFTGDDIFPGEDYINRHFENYLKYGDQVATLGRIDWHPKIPMNHLMRHITEIGCEQFGFIALMPYQPVDFRHFYTSNISVPAALLHRQDCFFHTGFDKCGFEDIELGYRLQKAGMRLYYDPDLLAYHYHVYDSVEKFCDRQLNAGRQLVAFSHMHDDLADQCICDVENCMDDFSKYKKGRKGNVSLRGKLIQNGIQVAKKSLSGFEKRIQSDDRAVYKTICSLAYAALFRFYYAYGTVSCAAAERRIDSRTSQMVDFTCRYLRKPYQELYWNTGEGFREQEARKWVYWDDSETVFIHVLPDGVRELWIAPLKDYCKAKIMEMSFVLEDGKTVAANVTWHNACQADGVTYDFSNTNDPCIIIGELPAAYRSIRIRMRVKALKKNMGIYQMFRNAAARMFHRMECRVQNAKPLKITYAYGQRRRIQIGVGGKLPLAEKESLLRAYQEQVSVLGEDVAIQDAGNMKSGYTDYLYEPSQKPLDITQMLQVAYMLLNHVVDYALVSKSYIEYPQIACQDLSDVLIYHALLKKENGYAWMENACGRYMRLPAYHVETNGIDTQKAGIFVQPSQNGYLGKQNAKFRISSRKFGQRKGSKPLVFVIPIFLAVGGIERNTIEVMRQLKDRYDFCMITLEYHTSRHGSLHYQLDGICSYIFDLREMTQEAHFLETFYELKEIFMPDLLWLCNNSPWFEQHTAQIQQIFSGIPIVAQDVYDTRAGWIAYYKNPEVKSFQRFIAITKLIHDVFISEYHIPEEKIDIIYPAVDDTQIRKVKKSGLSYAAVCKKYGLDQNKKHFSYIARLAEQKNPIRYLTLVKKCIESGMDDIQFLMVGDGPYKQKVDLFLEKNNMRQHVVRLPYVKNIPELMCALDGLVITSDFEGMPIVCIEAMGMEVPVFSTDAGDTKRFLVKNRNGMILDETESDFNNFKNFLEHLEEYKSNAKKCSDQMLDYFSIRQVSRQYDQVFAKAMKGGKKDAGQQ